MDQTATLTPEPEQATETVDLCAAANCCKCSLETCVRNGGCDQQNC